MCFMLKLERKILIEFYENFVVIDVRKFFKMEMERGFLIFLLKDLTYSIADCLKL